MQGTIEPRMVFLVETLPCSTSCSSSPAHKGDAHAGTGRVLLQPPVPRCGGREELGGMLQLRSPGRDGCSRLSQPRPARAQPLPCQHGDAEGTGHGAALARREGTRGFGVWG